MCRTPLGDGAIERLLQAGRQRAAVIAAISRGLGLITVPQSRQVLGEVVPQEGVDVLQNPGGKR